MQLRWAIQAARAEGVILRGDSEDLDEALRRGEIRTKDLRLDDAVTGADLSRPGLRALIEDSVGNTAISHVFVHKADRLARPDVPVQGMLLEHQLVAAGLTVVFSDRVIRPSESGEADLSAGILSLMAYHESGNFLRLHAERVLLTQRRLAERGFWNGGRPPYGFARALLQPGGKLELIEPGRRVRQDGCHVIIVPHDFSKIAVWIRILDLADAGWGSKRIAAKLNMDGIPSPDSGRIRRDHGAPHRVSGMWHPNTVTHLIQNRAILAVLDYGRRSEGSHRRLSADGIRSLAEADRREDQSAKWIWNDPEVIISAPLGFDSLYEPERWSRIQKERKARRCSQRGKPRARDLGRYPLSGRTIDLTDGCGHPLWGRMHGKRRLLVCGQYMKSNAQECQNNSVDADAALGFVLATLRQIVAMYGGRSQIEHVLRDSLRRGSHPEEVDVHFKATRSLEQVAADYDVKIAAASRRLAIADDDLVPDIAAALRCLKTEVEQVRRQLADMREHMPTKSIDPEQEVQSAMAQLDELERVIDDGTARADLTAPFQKLNVWLGLEFTEGVKGKKRRVRKLLRGVLVFDDAHLPVPIYGKDHVTRDNCSAGTVQAVERNEMIPGQTDSAGGHGREIPITPDVVGDRLDCRREGISSTKVNRGEARCQ